MQYQKEFGQREQQQPLACLTTVASVLYVDINASTSVVCMVSNTLMRPSVEPLTMLFSVLGWKWT